jgi:multicomponent Na+:H+ antiporter subunit E
VISVVLVLFINRRGEMQADENFTIKISRLLVYLPWLAKEMILSALHVARVIFTPRMPLDPVLIRFKSRQPNDLARVILGNSITLTPGTLTVELFGNDFLVHALTRNTADGVTSGVMQTNVARLFTNEPGIVVSDIEYNPKFRRS